MRETLADTLSLYVACDVARVSRHLLHTLTTYDRGAHQAIARIWSRSAGDVTMRVIALDGRPFRAGARSTSPR
jgi:hypothetical protein